MKLLESFKSINGEGMYQGFPTLFLRFVGCNLRCSYCDTTYSYNGGEEKTAEEIMRMVVESGFPRVTITGGEPLLQGNEMYQLCNSLLRCGIKIEVETNGSLDITELPYNSQLCVTMDWKLPGSGMMNEMHTANLQYLEKKDVLKFVCGSREDLDMARHVLQTHKPKCNIFFSPVFGKIEPSEIVEYLLEKKMYDCRVQIQSHKVIWDPAKRGV
jgi:7-carboxy-7-deazaguanine synthase